MLDKRASDWFALHRICNKLNESKTLAFRASLSGLPARRWVAPPDEFLERVDALDNIVHPGHGIADLFVHGLNCCLRLVSGFLQFNQLVVRALHHHPVSRRKSTCHSSTKKGGGETW